MALEKDINVEQKLTSYAFTLTLQPKVYKLLPRNQYRKAVWEINSVISNHPITTEIQYVVPELTKAANIHFHGVINLLPADYPNANYQFQNMFRDLNVIGFAMLKPIDNYLKWEEYCYKDYLMTWNIVKLYNLFTWVKQIGEMKYPPE